MTAENRVEPWWDRPTMVDGIPFTTKTRRPRGTVVHVDGITLRARRGYSNRLAASLFMATRRHMVAEGYLP